MLQEMHQNTQTEAMPAQMCTAANNEVIGDNATGNITHVPVLHVWQCFGCVRHTAASDKACRCINFRSSKVLFIFC